MTTPDELGEEGPKATICFVTDIRCSHEESKKVIMAEIERLLDDIIKGRPRPTYSIVNRIA